MNKLINMSYKHYNKALDYINENKISMAKEELEKSIIIYAQDIEVLNLIGLCEYMLCDFSKAYAYWMKSIKYNDINNKAIEYIRYLSKDGFSDLVKNYNIGLDYFHNKNYNQSIEVFERIINEHEALIEPYEILCICNNNLNNSVDARKYANLLNEKDKDNRVNYSYLSLFNDKPIAKNLDTPSNEVKVKYSRSAVVKRKNNKLAYGVLITIIIGVLGLSYTFYKKYKVEQNKSLSIEEKLNMANENYELLAKDMESQKLENDEISNIFKIQSYETKKSIFNNAVNYYRNKDYNNAINSFEYVINNCDEDKDIKSEATYFLAVSNEKINNFDKAKKYYKDYINNYKADSLYDEVLYNYALMLDKQNNVKEAKEVANKLKVEYSKSMFTNSNIMNILQK